MKKFFLLILSSLIILLSSCAMTKFDDKKELVRKIKYENYLNSMTVEEEKRSAYFPKGSDRLYILYENDDKLVMKIKDSYYSKGILEYKASKYNEDNTYLDYSIKEDYISYDLKTKELTIKDEKKIVDLNKESFIDYVFKYYNDEIDEDYKMIYELIQYFTKEAMFLSVFEVIDKNIDYTIIEGEVSWYYLEDNDNLYFTNLKEKLTEEEYKILKNYLYDICISTFGSPGNFKFMFYVSNDYEYVYPYLEMYYKDAVFYKLDVMDTYGD